MKTRMPNKPNIHVITYRFQESPQIILCRDQMTQQIRKKSDTPLPHLRLARLAPKLKAP